MRKNVIIIDDDKIICKITKRMFQISGLSKTPMVFNSGKEALDFLTLNVDKNEETLIFLDINMPEMNGWQFLETLEKNVNLTNTTIYLITSSIFPEDHQKAKENEYITDILIKPITLEKTKELVTQLHT